MKIEVAAGRVHVGIAGVFLLGAFVVGLNMPDFRPLIFGKANEDIALKSYSQAENFVFYGTDNKGYVERKDKAYRWEWGKYTTKLVDDFENVLAALIALKNNENELFVRRCREAEKCNISKPGVPITVLDKLQSIWKEVLPQRELIPEDSKFYATFENNG